MGKHSIAKEIIMTEAYFKRSRQGKVFKGKWGLQMIFYNIIAKLYHHIEEWKLIFQIAEVDLQIWTSDSAIFYRKKSRKYTSGEVSHKNFLTPAVQEIRQTKCWTCWNQKFSVFQELLINWRSRLLNRGRKLLLNYC